MYCSTNLNKFTNLNNLLQLLVHSPLCFALLQRCILCTHMHNTRPHPCKQPHKQGEWGGQHKPPRGPPWGSKWLTHWVSLTECVTQNANCAYLCSHVPNLLALCTPSELHFSSTNIPPTSFTPHHSYELLPLLALATHPPHLPPYYDCPPQFKPCHYLLKSYYQHYAFYVHICTLP